MTIELEEKLEIFQFLEKYHSLFRAFAECGEFRFSDDVPRAAVGFNAEGDFIDFVFNGDFYKALDFYNRAFIICHEMLHVILEHGKRTKSLREKYTDQFLNVALDVVVNHMLVDGFGFDRNKIDNWEQFCWVDTVFESPEPTGKSIEYYINKMKLEYSGGRKIKVGTVDGHLFEKDESIMDKLNDANVLEQTIDDDFLEALEKGLSKEQQKEMEKHAGNTPEGITEIINKRKVRKKRKWETVIKKWAVKKITDSVKKETRWDLIDRRFSDVLSRNSGYFLPTENTLYEKNFENKKAEVFFFLDTSGSCAHLKDRFFDAARSLPKDKFNIRLFCFDTRVYETTLESGKLYGFGGTSFSPIEEEIQKIVKKEKIKYPDAVWVITDGFGNTVRPQIPKNWHWFLTSCGTRHYIPSESYVYELNKFD